MTLAIGTNPSGGTLTCTTNPVTVVSGVATFAGCQINNIGTGYTLTASGGSLTPATSASFNVTQNPPASITLAITPDTISANGTATAIATATVRDAGNNLLPGETVVFSTTGDVTFGSVADNGNGTYSVTVTASTSPGDETITATDSSLSASAVLHETLYCPGTCFTDTASSDFLTGTPGSVTYVAQTENGEVILAPTVGAEFYDSTTIPNPDWEVLTYGGGSPSVTVSGGQVHVGTARLRQTGLYGPGRVLEFVATYTGGLYQAGGWGYSFNGADGYIWSTFDTVNIGTALYTNTNNTYYHIPETSGSWLNSAHRYRIEWTSTGVTYFIDGNQVRSDTATFLQNMRPMFADNVADSNLLHVDWVRMSPYASTGTYLSRVLDSGGPSTWGNAAWTAETPAGTSVTLSVRSGNTATPDGTWTTFSPITNGASIGVTGARYLQYQAVLTTSNTDRTPALKEICISYTDSTAPAIVSQSPAPNATNVAISSTVTVGFSEPMLASTINTSTFRLRASGATSDVPATVSYAGTTATLTPTTALSLATQYQVTVAGTVSDVNGNPLGSDVTWSFTTGSGSFTDSAFADFGSGTPSGVYVSEAYNGEIILTPTVVSEFSGTTDPAGWTSAAWNGTKNITYGGGWASLQNAQLYTDNLYTQGRSIEFIANFSGGAYQTGGLGGSASQLPIAVFNYDSTGTLLRARTWSTVDYPTNTPNPDLWDGAPHRYRIEWNVTPGQIVYYIDEMEAGRHLYDIPGGMRPLFTDYAADGKANLIDWVRMSPYAASGTFISRVFDAGQIVDWQEITATATLPTTGTTITFETRTGETAFPDGSWSAWSAVNSPIASPDGRYLQYRATFNTSDLNLTPTLSDVTITYGAAPTAVLLSSFSGEAFQNSIRLNWVTGMELDLLGFNIYRSESINGDQQKRTPSPIEAKMSGQTLGAAYQFFDDVEPGKHYYYWLELVQDNGSEFIGPIEPHKLFFIPFVSR